mmetsp:Transcript_8841/g.16008  ORF Transcript_8841/g.16008 Transcript_8841/m.16008 type:complete len:202 (+) Transcript_8841:721-1326(+)
MGTPFRVKSLSVLHSIRAKSVFRPPFQTLSTRRIQIGMTMIISLRMGKSKTTTRRRKAMKRIMMMAMMMEMTIIQMVRMISIMQRMMTSMVMMLLLPMMMMPMMATMMMVVECDVEKLLNLKLHRVNWRRITRNFGKRWKACVVLCTTITMMWAIGTCVSKCTVMESIAARIVKPSIHSDWTNGPSLIYSFLLSCVYLWLP